MGFVLTAMTKIKIDSFCLAIKAARGEYDLRLPFGRTLPKKAPQKTKIKYHQEKINNNHLGGRPSSSNL
jgi:hypothetical protein